MSDSSDPKTDSQQSKPEGSAETSKASNAVSLEQGRGGIVGVKAGMTQIYNDQGGSLGVTVIDLRDNIVTQVKTKEKEGYSAVQVGVLEKKEKSSNRPEKGHAKKAGAPGFYHYQEFRFGEKEDLSAIKTGQVLTAGFLKEGDFVDLTSTSKGKGFQGTMKRHHFAGGPASHGASVVHRAGGSIGNRATPGKVVKGRKMSGQMGNKKVTVQSVKVVKVDLENQFLLLHGAVPGPTSGIVSIRKAVKRG